MAFVQIFISLVTGPFVSKSVPVCIGLFKQIFGETECLLVLKFELSFGSNIEGLFHGCYRQI